MSRKFTIISLMYIMLLSLSFPASGEYDPKFFRLCREGNYGQVLEALRSVHSLKDMKTLGGFTALMAASENNPDVEVISLLLQRGAEVNAVMFSGMTALLWAAWRNPNPEVIRVLVSHGADVNVEADNGKRATDYAYMNEHLAGTEIIRQLENGNVTLPAKVPALVENVNKHETVKTKPSVTPAPVSPIKKSEIETAPFSEKKQMNATEFLELCASGTPNEIWEAIKKGKMNPNTKNYYSTTAVMFAAEKNNDINAIWWLYRAGADVNARDNGGQTPLMYAAASNRNPDILKVLLKAGADINTEDNGGKTALMIAAGKNPNANVVRVLSEAGKSEINRQGARGWTALFWAAYLSENPEVITVLLKAGANPKIKGSVGELAVDYARRNKYLVGSEALRVLEELSH